MSQHTEVSEQNGHNNVYDKNERLHTRNLDFYLDSKLIYALLCVVSLGGLPLYVFIKKTIDSTHLDPELKAKHDEYERDQYKKQEFINHHYRFANNLITYVNSGSSLLVNKRAKTSKKIDGTCLLVKVFLSLITCFFYSFYLIYRANKEQDIHEELNTIVGLRKYQALIESQQEAKIRTWKELEEIKALNNSINKPNDFNFENTIVESLKSNNNNKKDKRVDPFTFFLFICSYLVLGVITCGAFFIYLAYKKYVCKVQYNFFDHFMSKEVMDKNDFNDRLRSLTNNKLPDYSSLLSAKPHPTTNAYDYSSSFRSIFFKHQANRFISLCLLSLLTFGLFPVWLFCKFIFGSLEGIDHQIKQYKFEPLSLSQEDYWFNKLRFRLKCLYDFNYDIKLATMLTTSKVLRACNTLEIKPTSEDYGFIFIRIITTQTFKWAFTIVLLLINYTLGCIWMFQYQFALDNLVFIFFMSFLSFFVISISYHIFLLF